MLSGFPRTRAIFAVSAARQFCRPMTPLIIKTLLGDYVWIDSGCSIDPIKLVELITKAGT